MTAREGEARDEHQPSGAAVEEGRQLAVTLAIDGAVGRGSLHEDRPVAARQVDDEIGQLAALVERDADLGEAGHVEDRSILAGIADVENASARGPTWAELLDHLLDQDVLTASGELDFGAVGQHHRYLRHPSVPGVLRLRPGAPDL